MIHQLFTNFNFFFLYFSIGHHDPCEKLSCPKYAKCVPSFDGTSASCVCPEPCSNDPVDETTVVCGKSLTCT